MVEMLVSVGITIVLSAAALVFVLIIEKSCEKK